MVRLGRSLKNGKYPTVTKLNRMAYRLQIEIFITFEGKLFVQRGVRDGEKVARNTNRMRLIF